MGDPPGPYTLCSGFESGAVCSQARMFPDREEKGCLLQQTLEKARVCGAFQMKDRRGLAAGPAGGASMVSANSCRLRQNFWARPPT